MTAIAGNSTACNAIEKSVTAVAAMNAASGFTEVENQTCQPNGSMSTILVNSKAWISEYWNSSSDVNTSISMVVGVNIVGGETTNIGNLEKAKTRQKVNKFVSSVRIAVAGYSSQLDYGGIRYKKI